MIDKLDEILDSLTTITKDWTGNKTSVHATLGARNYALAEREHFDLYATEPKFEGSLILKWFN